MFLLPIVQERLESKVTQSILVTDTFSTVTTPMSRNTVSVWQVNTLEPRSAPYTHWYQESTQEPRSANTNITSFWNTDSVANYSRFTDTAIIVPTPTNCVWQTSSTVINTSYSIATTLNTTFHNTDTYVQWFTGPGEPTFSFRTTSEPSINTILNTTTILTTEATNWWVSATWNTDKPGTRSTKTVWSVTTPVGTSSVLSTTINWTVPTLTWKNYMDTTYWSVTTLTWYSLTVPTNWNVTSFPTISTSITSAWTTTWTTI